MIEALERDTEEVTDDLSARHLLASIKASRDLESTEAARQLRLAARWADLHPPESIHSAASFTVPGCEHEEPIAGQGCPAVAEFCVAELGGVLGISSTAAKKLIGHALELRHRLPRLWAQVHSGQVPAWRARAVAETTIHTTPSLTPEAAGWVDAQVAAVAGRIGPAQLARLVAEAIKRYDLAPPDPASDPEDGHLHVDPRHVTVNDEDVHFAGTMRIEAEVDIADALDFARAVAHGAAVKKALGSTESLDVRRAKTVGDLARTQIAFDLAGLSGDTDSEGSDSADNADNADSHRSHGNGATPEAEPNLPAAREVVLHAHFDAHFESSAVGEMTVFGPTGRLEERRRLLLLEQVRSWCADSRTKVTIKPVIDLNTDLLTLGYTVPDRIREQVVLRDTTCVFPWCSRPARGCDIDHVVAYDHHADTEGRPQPGPTRTSNLAALCRFHHRLKTHTAWTYAVTGPGTFEWTSPHGHRYRRDPSGTSGLEPAEPSDIPRPRRP